MAQHACTRTETLSPVHKLVPNQVLGQREARQESNATALASNLWFDRPDILYFRTIILLSWLYSVICIVCIICVLMLRGARGAFSILPCQFLRSLETERTSLALCLSLHTLCVFARVCVRAGARVRTGRYL